MKANYSYNPIAVSSSGDREWSVVFQLEPNRDVIVSGEKPDITEFICVCSESGLPVLAVESLYVAACVAFDAKEAKDGANA